MNQGKKLIRNTVFTLWGVAAFYVGWNRLSAAVVDADTAAPLRAAMTLGLSPTVTREAPPSIDLATVRDFTHVGAFGRLKVEIVGGQDYRVSVVPDPGQDVKYRAWREGSALRVATEGNNDGPAAATLHIEVPTLRQITVNVRQLSVRGLDAPELELISYNGGSATLLQNQIGYLRMVSYQPLEVQIDDATFAAGTIKANGDVRIRRAE
jgi:hypothetical protein